MDDRSKIVIDDGKSMPFEEIKCPKCDNFVTTLPMYLARHIKRMHSRSHKCKKCDGAFDTQTELRKHVAKEHPKMKRCPHCSYQNRQLKMVIRHQNQMHGDGAIPCAVPGCKMKVAFGKLLRHMEECHGEKNLDSRVSPPKNNNTKKVNQTQSSVDAIPASYKCPHCATTRADRRSLHRHIARVHERRYQEKKNPAQKSHKCPENDCDKSFATVGRLQDHIRSAHTKERPFQCENCARNYATRESFAVHLRRYHGTSIRALKKQIRSVCENSEILKSVSNKGVDA